MAPTDDDIKDGKRNSNALTALSHSSAPTKRRKLPRKSKDAPMRPLSAYNFFFREQRHLWLQEVDAELDSSAFAAANSPKKFEAMAKAMGARWKALTKSERQCYEEMAAIDQERYRHETIEYRDKMVRESALGAAYLERKRLAEEKARGEASKAHAAIPVEPPVTAQRENTTSALQIPTPALVTTSFVPQALPHDESTRSSSSDGSANDSFAPGPAGLVEAARQVLVLQLQLQKLQEAQAVLAQMTVQTVTSSPPSQLHSHQVLPNPCEAAATALSPLPSTVTTNATESVGAISRVAGFNTHPNTAGDELHPLQHVLALLQHQKSLQEQAQQLTRSSFISSPILPQRVDDGKQLVPEANHAMSQLTSTASAPFFQVSNMAYLTSPSPSLQPPKQPTTAVSGPSGLVVASEHKVAGNAALGTELVSGDVQSAVAASQSVSLPFVPLTPQQQLELLLACSGVSVQLQRQRNQPGSI